VTATSYPATRRCYDNSSSSLGVLNLCNNVTVIAVADWYYLLVLDLIAVVAAVAVEQNLDYYWLLVVAGLVNPFGTKYQSDGSY
jgi:hypothetical protein